MSNMTSKSTLLNNVKTSDKSPLILTLVCTIAAFIFAYFVPDKLKMFSTSLTELHNRTLDACFRHDPSIRFTGSSAADACYDYSYDLTHLAHGANLVMCASGVLGVLAVIGSRILFPKGSENYQVMKSFVVIAYLVTVVALVVSMVLQSGVLRLYPWMPSV